ncbi:MAG: Gfo/Idh/MocA family protein [Planctomycetota bacterium]|jgi:NDP-hexose-3-ketoreductase
MDVRWGFLGTGRVTERMVAAIRSRPGHRIAMAAGRDPSRLKEWGQRHQVDSVTTDLMEVVRSPEVDAIYVALPPALHCDWTCRALKEGKRVLCEKPLGLNADECRTMIQACRDASSPLIHATGFVHHPRSHAIRACIRSGELGSIRRVTVACTFSSVAERQADHRFSADAGGGCLLDLGWYCVYATLWFTGLRPLELMSYGSRKGGTSGLVWDQVQTIARLDGGALGVWDCGYDAAGRKWIEIAGSKASVICDDFLRPWDLSKPRFWVHGQDGKARAELVGEGILQESWMIQHAALAPMQATLESLELALSTQTILDQIQANACKSAFTNL